MTTIQGFRTAVALAALATASAAQSATSYSFATLDSLGGSTSSASALNASGVVVGMATQPLNDDDPPMEPTRPARWVKGQVADIGVLGNGPFGRAYGINDAGQTVGASWLPNSAGVHATLWDGVTKTDLGTLGGTESEALAINKAGVIVGYSMTRGNKRVRATVWKDGSIKALKDLGGQYSHAQAISKNGIIVGNSQKPDGSPYAVRWQGGVLTEIGTGSPMAVNSAGTVVGTMPSPPDGYGVAAKWVGDQPVPLPALGGYQGAANGINDAGDIVGAAAATGCCDYHAILWRNNEAIDLNDIVDQSVRDAGWVLTSATAIDRTGRIVGGAGNAALGVYRAFVLTPQP